MQGQGVCVKAAVSFPDHSFGCDHQNCAQLPTLRCLQPLSDVIWPQASSATATHSGEENGAVG